MKKRAGLIKSKIKNKLFLAIIFFVLIYINIVFAVEFQVAQSSVSVPETWCKKKLTATGTINVPTNFQISRLHVDVIQCDNGCIATVGTWTKAFECCNSNGYASGHGHQDGSIDIPSQSGSINLMLDVRNGYTKDHYQCVGSSCPDCTGRLHGDMIVTAYATCTNECSAGNYYCPDGSPNYRVCNNYDADPCLEWSSWISCGSEKICKNNQCTACPAETCNNKDDDCDSLIDEDLGSTTCGVGACQKTTQNCLNGVPQICVPGQPTAETCNGLDDDCDGFVDEDLGGVVHPVAGTVSWWPGDGKADDIVSNNNGALRGDTTFMPGKILQAFSLDGTEDYVLAPANNIGNLQQLAIEAFVKLDSMPAGTIKRFVTLTGEKAVLRYDGQNGPGQLHFYMKINGALKHIRINNILQAGVFYHVVGTYDGNVMLLYLNGAKVGELAVSGSVAIGTAVELSSKSTSLNGLLDEVKIYNRSLAADEVLQNYQDGLAGKRAYYCKELPVCNDGICDEGESCEWYAAESRAMLCDGQNSMIPEGGDCTNCIYTPYEPEPCEFSFSDVSWIIPESCLNGGSIGSGAIMPIVISTDKVCDLPDDSEIDVKISVKEKDTISIDDDVTTQPDPSISWFDENKMISANWIAEYQEDESGTDPEYYIRAEYQNTAEPSEMESATIRVKACDRFEDEDCDGVDNSKDNCLGTAECTSVNSNGCTGQLDETCSALWDCSAVAWGDCINNKQTRNICNGQNCCNIFNSLATDCACQFTGQQPDFEKCGKAFMPRTERACLEKEEAFPIFTFANLVITILVLTCFYVLRKKH